MPKNTKNHDLDVQAERIAELEDTLKQRDRRIVELTAERDEERELAAEMREYAEDAHAMIERWIEAFDMEMNDDGVWEWGTETFIDRYHTLMDRYLDLSKRWNKIIPYYNAVVAPRLRNLGRPLAASLAQKADVLKRRKAGQSLRGIADETFLSLRTVRTIVDKANGVDRATLARLQRIMPDRLERLAQARERANTAHP